MFYDNMMVNEELFFSEWGNGKCTRSDAIKINISGSCSHQLIKYFSNIHIQLIFVYDEKCHHSSVNEFQCINIIGNAIQKFSNGNLFSFE